MEGHQRGENQTEGVLYENKAEAGLPECSKEQEIAMDVELYETDSEILGWKFMKVTLAETAAVTEHIDSNCANPAGCYVQNYSEQTTIVEDVEPKPPEPFENPFD